MTVAYVLWVLGIIIVLGAGLLAYRYEPGGSAVVQRPLRPLVRVRDFSRLELGNLRTAIIILLASTAATVAVTWPVGRFARRFVSSIDEPILRWTLRHNSTHGAFHQINYGLTLMGNPNADQYIALGVGLIFAAIWWRRGWYIPILLMAAAWGMEKAGQMVTDDVAHRPKAALSSIAQFPSGGVARLLTDLGMVLILTFLTWPAIKRAWRVAGWTLLALLVYLEAYSRIFLIKHWAMDVLGGVIFGTLLLFGLIATASCFGQPSPRQTPDGSPDHDPGHVAQLV